MDKTKRKESDVVNFDSDKKRKLQTDDEIGYNTSRKNIARKHIYQRLYCLIADFLIDCLTTETCPHFICWTDDDVAVRGTGSILDCVKVQVETIIAKITALDTNPLFKPMERLRAPSEAPAPTVTTIAKEFSLPASSVSSPQHLEDSVVRIADTLQSSLDDVASSLKVYQSSQKKRKQAAAVNPIAVLSQNYRMAWRHGDGDDDMEEGFV